MGNGETICKEATMKSNKRTKCSLFPYDLKPALSIQEANQRIGWNLSAFNIPSSWEKIGQGEDVVVAVLDSGCDLNHSDLCGNLRILNGSNFINRRKPPEDDNSHGTHVIGIIAAKNNNLGVVGVAPRCIIIPIKVLDANGNGDLISVSNGIRFAVDNGAEIIVMSLGAPFKVQQVRKAIQYAASKGIPCFVAAGNSGKTKEVFYPANYPETIAIGSIDKNLNRSSFSNTGMNLDFMTPGHDVFSTIPNNWYGTMSGTSMACPFAAGVAALMLSYSKKRQGIIQLNTVEDYRDIFKKHTVPINNKKYSGNKFFEGYGIIEPQKLFEWMKSQ